MPTVRMSANSCLLLAILVLFSLIGQTTTAQESVVNEIESSILNRLASASSESEGREIEAMLWEYWFSLAPTVEDRQLLDNGRERREAYDFEAAENYFDQLVEQAPLYFEAYNQRAFARFLRENYSGALTDLEKTLALYPDHFGALSGMYHILRIQGRHDSALKILQRAVIIHPWLQERGALPEAMWPDSYRAIHEPGQEI